MEFNENYTSKITPEKALKMLTDEGMNVTLEQATEILSFLKLIAGIRVKKFLKDSETNKATEKEILNENLEINTKKAGSNKSNKKTVYCNTCNFLSNSF